MERTWESGEQEAAMNEVLLQMHSTKHSWGQSEDTLESIVHSSLSRKRTRSSSDYCKDESLMSGASLESHRTFKTKNSIQDLAPDHDGSVMFIFVNLFLLCHFVYFLWTILTV